MFWQFIDKKRTDPRTGEESTDRFPMLRLYHVFNVEQCEGLELAPVQGEPIPEPERDKECDAFTDATGADVRHGGGRAYYDPMGDFVRLPKPQTFKDSGAYYSTLFHELTHWTGSRDRCDRTFGKRFGDRAYAIEELAAEMGSAFLCQKFQVDGTLQHPEYLANWLKALRDDSRFLFSAASAARKACEWMYEQAGIGGKILEPKPVAA